MSELVSKVLQKRAGAVGDALKAVPSTLIPNVGIAATGVGASIGELEGFSHDKDVLLKKLKEFEEHPHRAWAPGVGAYRLGARKVMTQKLLEDKKDKDRSTGTSRAVLNQLSLINPLNLLGAVPAALLAAITKSHKLKDTADAVNDNHYTLKSLLIPGWDTYKAWKAVGTSDKLSKGTYTEEEAKELDPETASLLLAELKKRKADKKSKDK